MRRLSILLSCALLSGCASAGLLVLNTQARLLDRHRQFNDLVYGANPWQKLDVYVPEAAAPSAGYPVLLFFYGGGWEGGDKDQYLFLAEAFTREGYAVVIPNYVQYPQGKFTEFMHDGARSVRWIIEEIAQFGGDPQRLFVMGHSAGAHLGALLLADQSYLESLQLHPNQVKAFVGLAGPYNFTPRDPTYVAVFGPPDNFVNMYVSNFIDGDEPPFLLLTGGADIVVHPWNMESLEKSIIDAGGQVKTKTYPEVNHAEMVAGFSRILRHKAPLVEDILQFFEQHGA